MENIDKSKLKNHIENAYENQSDRVKELLQSAKVNLESEKKETFTGKSEKIRQISNIKNVINKNTSMINQIEEILNSKFNEVNDNISANSKNLDLLFNKDPQNKNYEKLLQEIKKELIENINSIRTQENIKGEVLKLLENVDNSQLLETISKLKDEIIEETKKGTQTTLNQNEINKELIDGIKSKIYSYIETANDNQKEKIINFQAESERRMIKSQEGSYNKIVDLQYESEKLIVELQEKNEKMLNQIKEEMFAEYKKVDKNVFSKYLEEKNVYIKELEEKDRQIRELNYKIYEYEGLLSKEIERRQRSNIFRIFKRNNYEEEQEKYTCQILNYVVQ